MNILFLFDRFTRLSNGEGKNNFAARNTLAFLFLRVRRYSMTAKYIMLGYEGEVVIPPTELYPGDAVDQGFLQSPSVAISINLNAVQLPQEQEQ